MENTTWTEASSRVGRPARASAARAGHSVATALAALLFAAALAIALAAAAPASQALADEPADAAANADVAATSDFPEPKRNAAATVAINALKALPYYAPGGACPQGQDVGWLSYAYGDDSCAANCYAFACGVCDHLFGTFPFGIMDTGYTADDPRGLDCVGALEDPSREEVQRLMLEAYPGDYIQFCSGAGWGYAQHSAIVEAVDEQGVRIYQHGDSSHVSSTYYPWDEFYEGYLGMTAKNYRGYTGIGLYHARNYEERYPQADSLAFCLDGGLYTDAAANAGFLDLAPTAWYMDASGGAFPGTLTLYLDYTVGRGLMRGKSSTSFDPEGELTRAQAAMVLFRLANPGVPNGADANKTGLPDVKSGEWYTRAVNWCYEQGVVTGYLDESDKPTAFGPEDPVTREQLAVMIERYCVELGGLSAVEDMPELPYADKGDVGEWAWQGMAFCNAFGIMTGLGGTDRFGVGQLANRAQMAKIIAVTSRLLTP